MTKKLTYFTKTFSHSDVLYPDKLQIVSLDKIKITEWDLRFERFMRNRLIFGGLRYGLMYAADKAKWDRLGSILDRCVKYMDNGNDELLVDIANLALLEFAEGTHPRKHFKSVDDGEHCKEIK